ncbi:MAG: HAMP domain-containing histidine kinase [Ktedonobacteraceae bacterium]|nr:HAMP domain-containing histidine kinase [Ktedonobacteraceae bacterium]
MQMQHEQTHEQIIEALQHQVDELTKANLVLKEQLARKEQFTAMIAHELRGPLAPIINYAQMIARPNQRPETVKRGTSIIISQAHRLTRLVKDLLDATHLTFNQFSLTCAECDIVTLAKEVVEQLRPLAPYHQVVLETPDSPVVGNWDSGRLQQALGNLLDNAMKYSDEGSTITVCVSASDAMAHVSVHNQGAGIPSAEIHQLFRPYVRLQGTSGRQGSGLGLYITKSIIEAHEGSLRLELPSPERQGTTFSFDLPL